MRKFLTGMAMLVLVIALAACTQETKTVAKEPVAKIDGGEIALNKLGEIQPGAGVIMMRIAQRATTTYYAAKAGKWELASYELEEITGDFETIGITRPKRKDAMDKFINGSALADLNKAVKDKDGVAFGGAFDNVVIACNNCHDASDSKFIRYVLPTTAPDVPSLK